MKKERYIFTNEITGQKVYDLVFNTNALDHNEIEERKDKKRNEMALKHGVEHCNIIVENIPC